MNVIILLKNFELELVKESFVEVGENFSYFFFLFSRRFVEFM